MIIEYQGKDNFIIKTKGKTVKIGKEISLGDLEINSPGEYESGGVQVEVIDGTIEIFSEKITLAWIKKGKILSDEELERLNSINILIIGVGGGEFTESKTAIDVMNQIEPAIVIPMYIDGLEAFLKEEGTNSQAVNQLKLNFADLPQEERKVIVLNPLE